MAYHCAWCFVLLYLKILPFLCVCVCVHIPSVCAHGASCSTLPLSALFLWGSVSLHLGAAMLSPRSHLHRSCYLDGYCKENSCIKQDKHPHLANAGGAQSCNLLLYQTVVCLSPSYHYRVFLDYKINLAWLCMIGGQNLVTPSLFIPPKWLKTWSNLWTFR